MDPLSEEIPTQIKSVAMFPSATTTTNRVVAGGRRATPSTSGRDSSTFNPTPDPVAAVDKTIPSFLQPSSPMIQPTISAPPPIMPKTNTVPKPESDDEFDLPDDSAPANKGVGKQGNINSTSATDDTPAFLRESTAPALGSGAKVLPGRKQMVEEEKIKRASAEKEKETAIAQKNIEEKLHAERARVRKEVEDELRNEMVKNQTEKSNIESKYSLLQETLKTERSKWEALNLQSSNEIGMLHRQMEDMRVANEKQAQATAEMQRQLNESQSAAIAAVHAAKATASQQQQQQQAPPDTFKLHLDQESLDTKLQSLANIIAQQVAETQKQQAQTLVGLFRSELQETEKKILSFRDERLHIEQEERMRLLQEERDTKLKMEIDDRNEKRRREEDEREERRSREEADAKKRQDTERDERIVRMKREMEEREHWMESERQRSQAAMTEALQRLATQHKISEEHYLRISAQQAKEMEARFVSEKTQMQYTHKAQMDALTQRFQQLMALQEDQHKKSLESMSMHAENASAIRETWAVLQKNVEGLAHLRMVFERQEAILQSEKDQFNREREVVLKELTMNLSQQHALVEREKHQLANMLTEIQTVYSTQNETLCEERNRLTVLMKKGEAQRQMWEKEHRQWLNERSAIDLERNELMASVKTALQTFIDERRKVQQQREELESMKDRLSHETAQRQDAYERHQVELDERIHKARSLVEQEFNRVKSFETDLQAREEDFQKKTIQLKAAALEVQRRAEEAEMGMRAAEQKLEAAEKFRETLHKNTNVSMVMASSDDERQRLRKERKELEEERLRFMAIQNERHKQQQNKAASIIPTSEAAPHYNQRQHNRNDELDRRIDQVLSLYPAQHGPKYRWDPSASMMGLNNGGGRPEVQHQSSSVTNAAMQTSRTSNASTSTHTMNPNLTSLGLPTPNLTHLLPISSDHDTTTTSSRFGGTPAFIQDPRQSSSSGKDTLTTPSIYTTETS
eukprot:PhF_6_TR13435/c1_g1_i1/m.21446